ncbi:hypothetical protein PLICRDRAFT_27665 [Plicaturopsis crispa FD-325 SS-3]|nr:hypothetical protein PLICRDRAFT_27665 [Plicaturopsis crispa FD-325 SS-3]
MGAKCAMNMIWNTQIIDTCIVFPFWHISSNASFVFSFFVVVALGVGYEYLRAFQRSVDRRIAASLKAKHGGGRSRSVSGERGGLVSAEEASYQEEGLLTGRRVFKTAQASGTPVPFGPRVLRAVLYGATVFLSFFLMLVFMTYNAYLILAVVVGAAIGHYVFGARIDVEGAGDAKGMACH